jgi:hypothetical protein
MAAVSAAMPSRSDPSVRSAEAMCACVEASVARCLCRILAPAQLALSCTGAMILLINSTSPGGGNRSIQSTDHFPLCQPAASGSGGMRRGGIERTQIFRAQIAKIKPMFPSNVWR